ncbi:hypothetical protein VSS37_11810 [Candidatus Thiothrix sp. Deng01]|uniref:Uncharacterized protein n=1 Tax=Candidatus Thiothrix phosphatis TaxID=3112415 RepID=A0ABU6D039_9GAMM|nr:hypothetical protein [Candidatus Thiothrix sp. Deng01]MEB4591667.1 hypothetical protein [Candidatus Thiothrix sp. Deng01]
MIIPGKRSLPLTARPPRKLDRWLVGLLAGAALAYAAGKALGLGKQDLAKKD